MKRTFLFLIIAVGIFVAGCQNQAEVEMKDQIQFTPNDEYVGDPHPVVEKEMKLTDEEKAEYEQVKQEIRSQTEDE